MSEQDTTTQVADTTTPAPEPTTEPVVKPDLLTISEGTDPAAEAGDPTKTAEAPTVPDVYELKAPDGLTFDEAALADFTPLAKELNLTNEAAQKLIDHYGPKLLATEETLKAAQQAEWVAKNNQWYDEMMADPEFGKANATENLGFANTALQTFFSPEDRAQLKAAGLANFPPLIKALARVGKGMAEPSQQNGGATTTTERNPAKILFPNLN